MKHSYLRSGLALGLMLASPALLAAGLPPVLANVSNTIGLVPGSISATLRRLCAVQR